MTLLKLGKVIEISAMVVFYLAYVGSVVMLITSVFFMTAYDWWVYVGWMVLVMMMWLLLLFPVKFKDEDWN